MDSRGWDGGVASLMLDVSLQLFPPLPLLSLSGSSAAFSAPVSSVMWVYGLLIRLSVA